MIKIAIKFKLLILLILILIADRVEAQKISYSLGVSYIYADINDRGFDYVDKYEMLGSGKDQLSSVSVNYSVFYNNNVNLTLGTNRLFNKSIKRAVISKKDGSQFESKSETKIDSLVLAYRFNRFNPGLFIANVKMNKHLLLRGSQIAYQNKSSILKGFNVSYFNKSKFSPSITYILPDKGLDLEGALSINVNYIF